MKPVITLVILLGSLLSSSIAIAACNVDIINTRPDTLYTDHGDGTVTDNNTDLMWQKCTLGLSGSNCATGTATTLTWQAALAAANNNTGNGYSDWRLPNKNELESLLEHACFVPAINETLFPATVAGAYWSSSPIGWAGSDVWFVSFYSGGVGSDHKTFSYSVRLVRSSQ